MQSIDNIPSYYTESVIFKKMIHSEKYKHMSFEDFKESDSFRFIRDESPIVDIDDLYRVLECLDYWLIEVLPSYVVDFVFHNDKGSFLIPLDLPFVEDLIKSWNQQIIDLSMLMLKNESLTLNKIGDPELYNLILKGYFKLEYSRLECGEYFSAAIRDNKSIVLWGGNDKDPDENSEFFIPVTVKEDGTIIEHNYPYEDKEGFYGYSIIEGSYIDVKCGAYFVLAMREDMTLFSFKNNSRIYTPEGKFIKISCGTYYSCGIREDGIMLVWDDAKIVFESTHRFKDVSCVENYISCIRNDGGLQILLYNHINVTVINIVHGDYINTVVGNNVFAAITNNETRNVNFLYNHYVSENKHEGKFTKLFSDKYQTLLAGVRVIDGKYSTIIFEGPDIHHTLDGSCNNIVFSENDIMILHSPQSSSLPSLLDQNENNGMSDARDIEGCKVSLIREDDEIVEVEGMFTDIAAGINHFSCVKIIDGVKTLFTFGDNSYGQCDNIPTL